MPRYHIHPERGPEICRVDVSNSRSTGCKFGEFGHYSNIDEVERVWWDFQSDRWGATSTLVAPDLQPLKEMGFGELKQVIEGIAKQEGYLKSMSEAVKIASVLHADQRRYNRGEFESSLYLEHPMRNSVRISRWGVKDESIMLAAVLHDTIEDGSVDYVKLYEGLEIEDELFARGRLGEEIGKRFGEETLRLVEAVTNDYRSAEEKAGETLDEKVTAYRNHVAESLVDESVMLVKLSDFIDNATGLYHNDLPERRDRVYKMAYKYLPVVEVFENNIGLLSTKVSAEVRREIQGQLARTRSMLQYLIDRG